MGPYILPFTFCYMYHFKSFILASAHDCICNNSNLSRKLNLFNFVKGPSIYSRFMLINKYTFLDVLQC